jgi:hypothetical protein
MALEPLWSGRMSRPSVCCTFIPNWSVFLMQRKISQLPQKAYDVAIIGGRINGACAAWDATL